MRIEWKKSILNLTWLAVALLLFSFSPLRAATVEVEDEDEAVQATPTSEKAQDGAKVKGKGGTSGADATLKKDADDEGSDDAGDEGQDAVPEIAKVKGSAGAAGVEAGASTKKAVNATEDESQDAVPEIARVKGSAGAAGVEAGSRRAHINDSFGFYYFLKSGFVSSDPSQLPSIGKVATMDDSSMSYSTPKKNYILLTPTAQKQIKVDDLLVIYRAKQTFQEARSGFSGYLVQNLAVVKVLEVQQRRCLVRTLESFEPFVVGDRVRLYDDEIGRWKQAQVKKSLPEHPVKCFVAGGESVELRHYWTTSDFIILTAGSKKGIVEGQKFELRKYENRQDKDESLHVPIGKAEVFYAGLNYSLARIETSQVPVEAGFEAFYDPAGEK